MHAMVQQVPLPGNSISPGTPARWRRWLERNHRDSRGVWVVVRRKDAAGNALAIDAAADEALCFGWVQQRSRALDDLRRLAWISPRPKRSGWTRALMVAVRRL
jgi:uncharacterized protein YdeI (YjbR/CyaY-like superfamily)